MGDPRAGQLDQVMRAVGVTVMLGMGLNVQAGLATSVARVLDPCYSLFLSRWEVILSWRRVLRVWRVQLFSI